MRTGLHSMSDRVRRPSARALVAGAVLLAVLLAAMAYAGVRWQARTGADEAPRTVEASTGGTLAVLNEQRAEWRAVCGEAKELYSPGLPAADAVGRAKGLVARNEAIMGQVRGLDAPEKGFDPVTGVVRALGEQHEELLMLVTLWEARAELESARVAAPEARQTAAALAREAEMNPGVGPKATKAAAEVARLEHVVDHNEDEVAELAGQCRAAAGRTEQASSVWEAF